MREKRETLEDRGDLERRYSEGQNHFHVFASATNDFIPQEPIVLCI